MHVRRLVAANELFSHYYSWAKARFKEPLSLLRPAERKRNKTREKEKRRKEEESKKRRRRKRRNRVKRSDRRDEVAGERPRKDLSCGPADKATRIRTRARASLPLSSSRAILVEGARGEARRRRKLGARAVPRLFNRPP
jgi:hypothetical protein